MSDIPEPDQQFGSLLTVQGENYEQQGIVDNKQIQFLKIAIGDANDTYVEPDRTRTALVNELARFEINAIDIIQPNPDDVPVLRVQAFLPGDVNGIVIRELAAVASYDGGAEYLHAVGNCGRIFVPVPDNNGGVTTPISIEMSFIITSAEPIIILNPSISIASREWVRENFVDFDTEQTISAKKIFDSTASQAFGTPTVPDKFGIGTLGEVWNLTTKDVGNAISVDENGNPSLYHDGVKTFETYETGVLARAPSGSTAEMGVVNADGSALLGVNPLGAGFLAVGTIAGAYAHKAVGWDSNGATELYHDGNKVAETYAHGLSIDIKDSGLRLMGSNGSSAFGQFDANGDLAISQNSNTGVFEKTFATFRRGGAAELYHKGVKTLMTESQGARLGTTGDSSLFIGSGNRYLLKAFASGTINYYVNGTNRIVHFPSDSNQLVGTWTGTVTPSDESIKTNLQPLNGLAKLQMLETYAWEWVDRDALAKFPTEGFTAQSYETVFPELVEAVELDIPDILKPAASGDTTTEVSILGIKKDITGLVMDAYIVDAIKEIAAKNTELEARIQALEGQSG